jgi:glycosyltransferase involved in cell wall biosynthesis
LTNQNGTRPKRILILCSAPFGERMSSPGIRARHMAEVLAAELPETRVTLAIPKGSSPSGDAGILPYAVRNFTTSSLPRLLFDHDIIIANDFPLVAMLAFPFRTFVLDYYTIYFIEWLDLSREVVLGSDNHRRAWLGGRRRRIGAELVQADFILTANDRQKDYYVGALIALGLIDPVTYDFDPGLHNLIEPAPHGIRPDPLPEPGKPALRGVYVGIKETDRLLIWNGGIVEWYDTETLLRAMAMIAQHRDDVKLVFVGGAYPGLGSVGLGRRFTQTVELAQELGLYNRNVFFDLSWVPYERMKDYMLEADLAVCTYFNNLETHFSFRTRFVDVFWAELPLICTEGDVLADMVRDRGLGIAVPEKDHTAVAAAIEKLLDDSDLYDRTKRNIRENNASMSWTKSFEQLVRFCRDPRSSALSKWRRTIMLGGAWAQWAAQRAATIWIR